MGNMCSGHLWWPAPHVTTLPPGVRSRGLDSSTQWQVPSQVSTRMCLCFVGLRLSLMPRKPVQYSKDGPQVLGSQCLWRYPTAKGSWESVGISQNCHRDNSEMHSMWFLRDPPHQWYWASVAQGDNQLSDASLHWCSLLLPPPSPAPWELLHYKLPAPKFLLKTLFLEDPKLRQPDS